MFPLNSYTCDVRCRVLFGISLPDVFSVYACQSVLSLAPMPFSEYWLSCCKQNRHGSGHKECGYIVFVSSKQAGTETGEVRDVFWCMI